MSIVITRSNETTGVTTVSYEQRLKLNEYDARDARGEEFSDSEFLEWEYLISLDLDEKEE